MSDTEEKADYGIWLGGIKNGYFLSCTESSLIPNIRKLGDKFNNFQNSQFRGEWSQKCTLTYGEISAILAEIAFILKNSN